MTSLKGFLYHQPGDKHPRMTADQKNMLIHAITRVMQWVPQDEQTQAAMMRLEHGVSQIPDDRSCFTCDYFQEGYCHRWKAPPTPDFYVKGCGEHKTEGAPF